MIANTIFIIIGVVGMGRTEQTAQVLIVLRVLILVSDDESDGAARRFAFEDTTEQFYLIRFLPRCGDFALSWATTVQLLLYERYVDVDAWRHAVDDPSDSLTMTLAKGGQCE